MRLPLVPIFPGGDHAPPRRTLRPRIPAGLIRRVPSAREINAKQLPPGTHDGRSGRSHRRVPAMVPAIGHCRRRHRVLRAPLGHVAAPPRRGDGRAGDRHRRRHDAGRVGDVLRPRIRTIAADATGNPDGDGRTNAQEFAARRHPLGRHVRYFAEGSTGYFDTSVAVLNLSATDTAHVALALLNESGGVVSHRFTLAPRAAADRCRSTRCSASRPPWRSSSNRTCRSPRIAS